ncbi:FAD-dependent oxidoreductase [Dactylosporangium sp. CA-139066]|uniref:FAD-dependent oxidoreductase n=1 Tax=Dactylosporangium sp. CA-139066 TaxID=3239930 RepID=UPI003D8C0565
MSEGATRVAVIGAGPAGATAAYCLAKAGAEVDVYEASGGVGGMARSIELWGQTVDIGPHRFVSSDQRVNELWLEVIGGDYEMVRRHSRVLVNGRLYHYPPRPREALAALGPLEAARCLASYAGRPRDPGGTFASWATARFGERLYRHGLAAYAEKIWGRPAEELDAELARQRLGDPAEHAGEFPHPRQGTGEVYARMCEHVEKQGGRVHLDTPVARLVLDGDRVTGVQLNSAEIVEHDHVVSSMPLTALAARLPGVPEEVAAATARLAFRNSVVVYLRTTAESVFPDTWLYVPGPELRAGRITNFDNWVPSTKRGERETVLALEYWCDPGDDFWRWDDERYVALARRELASTGLAEAGEIIDGEVMRVPKSCPVYRRGFRDDLRVIAGHLRRLRGLQVIGRYGAFRYNSQADSILMGLLAAQNVTAGAGHDLWSLDGHDPRAGGTRITATGLAPTRPSPRRR